MPPSGSVAVGVQVSSELLRMSPILSVMLENTGGRLPTVTLALFALEPDCGSVAVRATPDRCIGLNDCVV